MRRVWHLEKKFTVARSKERDECDEREGVGTSAKKDGRERTHGIHRSAVLVANRRTRRRGQRHHTSHATSTGLDSSKVQARSACTKVSVQDASKVSTRTPRGTGRGPHADALPTHERCHRARNPFLGTLAFDVPVQNSCDAGLQKAYKTASFWLLFESARARRVFFLNERCSDQLLGLDCCGGDARADKAEGF